MVGQESWPRVSVAEVCASIVDCVNKTAPVVDEPTPYKMIRTTNVRDGWVDLSSVRFVDATTYEKWTRRQKPRRGDVILTREAPLGEVGLLRSDDDVFLGQRLVAYRADPRKLDNRFLLYAMLGDDMQGQIRSMGSGATVEHMRVPDCEKLTLCLPELATQRRIASILSAYDDLIENNTRRIAILEEMARRIYEEWFVRFRFPGHEGVRMVESELGLVPEGWPVAPFIELCTQLTRGVTPKYRDGSGRFILNQKSNRGFELVETEFKELSEECAVPSEKFARFGDVLVNSLGEGTIGRVHHYSGESRDIAVDQHMTICRAAHPGLGRLIYQYLESPAGQERIRSVKTGATSMTMLNISALRQFKIARPPTTVLSAFWGACEPIVMLNATLRRKNANLRTTRDVLLPKLISGELDVSAVPNPEALAA